HRLQVSSVYLHDALPICILAGLEEPDAGRVSQSRGATVGYLPQDVAGAAATSVLGEALSGFDEVWRLEREMEEVAAALAAAPTEDRKSTRLNSSHQIISY